jgi:hypothetical protein
LPISQERNSSSDISALGALITPAQEQDAAGFGSGKINSIPRSQIEPEFENTVTTKLKIAKVAEFSSIYPAECLNFSVTIAKVV